MHQGDAGRGPPRDGSAGMSGGGGGDGGADRISDLPDDLCHRILSFLKAWEAVRTSALSRRWRHVWASAPCLDIRQPCACDVRADQERYDEFVKNLLIKRRPVPLDTLRLRWNHDVDTPDANAWIAYAIGSRNARVIELSGEHHYRKPEPAYTSFVPGNLKILKLSHITMDSQTLTQLCSRCTSLDELELKNCDIVGTEIRSTSLKRLTMVSCLTPSGLLVHAPNLVLLRCIRPYSVVPRIANSGSLVTATIMLDDSCLLHRFGHEWPLPEDDDDDDNYFAYADAQDPDDSESAHDDDSSAGADAEDPDYSESDHDDDSSTGSDAEDPDYIESSHDDDSSAGADAEDLDYSESGHDDDSSAGSDAEDSDYIESDHQYGDNDDYYGFELSESDGDADLYESSDKKGDDLDYGPNDYSGGRDGNNAIIIYGGDGILDSLSNVRTMSLLAHPGEVLLRSELKKCPIFKNLKTLSLGEWCIGPDFDALSTILERSPNIENLFLHLDMAYNSRGGINASGRSFACNNLKMVKITCSKDDMVVHMLAEFLHANGVPLDKIDLVRRTADTHNGKDGSDSRE